MKYLNVFDKVLLYVKIQLCRNYQFVKYFFIVVRNYFTAEKEVESFKNTPIIINNFNRYTMLKDLVGCFEKRGYGNIYIIDNNSTYPPLLEYYNTIPYHVFRLKENLGFMSFKKSGIYKMFRNKYYVYTDSDIFLPDSCPDDFIEFFFNELKSHKYISKVGNALRIDDLPDCYKFKTQVLEWESKHWENNVGNDRFIARIDTTIALYRPNFMVGSLCPGNHLRIAGKYTAVHRPWYLDSDNLDEEEKYYIMSAKQSTFWTIKTK